VSIIPEQFILGSAASLLFTKRLHQDLKKNIMQNYWKSSSFNFSLSLSKNNDQKL
jgi:hypothetical protein